MKKFIALIAVIAGCVISAASIPASAVKYVSNSSGKMYVEFPELEEYLSYTDKYVFKSLDPNNDGNYSYIFSPDLKHWTDMSFSYAVYNGFDDEQAEKLIKFIEEKYPEYTLKEESNGGEYRSFKLDFGEKKFTPEEAVAFVTELRNAVGKGCAVLGVEEISFIAQAEEADVLPGQENKTSEPETQSESETESESAVPVSESTSPQTGSSGVSGIVLALAGSVMAAAAFKRKK